MKFPLSVVTAAICVSLPAVQATQKDCLDAHRFNLESLCRNNCEQKEAVAFSVSYDDSIDTCRCYVNIDGVGTYTGSGDRESQVTCYSMGPGAKTRVLDYGDCIVDSSNTENQASVIAMKFCDNENQVDCLDKKGNNKESLCKKECSKTNSVAFAVSYAEDDAVCRCYPDNGIYTGNGQIDSQLTCYSMDGGKIRVLDYGDCIHEKLNGPLFTEHTMKRCEQEQQQQPHVGKILRGNVPV